MPSANNTNQYATRAIADTQNAVENISEKDAAGMRVEIHRLQSALNLAREQLTAESNACEENKKEFHTHAQNALASVQEELKALQAKLLSTNTAHQKAMEEVSRRLDAAMQKKDGAVSSFEQCTQRGAQCKDQLQRCKSAGQTCSAEWLKLRKEKESMTQKHGAIVASIQKKLDEERASLNAARQEHKQALEQVDRIKAKVAEEEHRHIASMRDMESKVRDRENKYSVAQAELTKLQGNLRDARELLQDAKKSETKTTNTLKAEAKRISEKHTKEKTDLETRHKAVLEAMNKKQTERTVCLESLVKTARKELADGRTQWQKCTQQMKTQTETMQRDSARVKAARTALENVDKNKQNETEQARKELELSKTKLRESMDRCTAVQAQHDALSESMKTRDANAAALRNQMDEVKVAHGSALEKMQREHVKRVESISKEYAEKMQDMEATMRTSAESANTAQAKLREKIESKQKDLQQSQETCRKEAREMQRVLVEAENKFTRQQQRNASDKSDLISKLKESQNLLQKSAAKCDELNRTVREQTQAADRLRQDMEKRGGTYDRKMEEMEKKLQKANDKNTGLQNNIQKLREELKSRVEEVKEGTASLSKCNATAKRATDAERTVKSLTGNLRTLKSSANETATKLKVANVAKKSTEEELANVRQQMENMRREMHAMQARLHSVNVSKSNMEEELKKVSKDLTSCAQVRTELTASLSSNRDTNSTLTENLKVCQSAEGRATTAMRKANEQVTRLTSVQTELKTRLESAKVEYEKSLHECTTKEGICRTEIVEMKNSHNEAMQAFQMQVNESLQKAKKASDDLAQMRDDHNVEIEDLANKISQKDTSARDLRRLLESATSSSAALKKKGEILQTEHEKAMLNMSRTVEGLKRDVAARDTVIEDKNDTIQRLEVRSNKGEIECKQITENMRKHVDKLKEENNRTRALLERARRDAVTLRDEHMSSTNRLDAQHNAAISAIQTSVQNKLEKSS